MVWDNLELQSESLVMEIERHTAKRKLILQATGLAHKHGHAFKKILHSNSQVQDLLRKQLLHLTEREKKIKIAWSRLLNS